MVGAVFVADGVQKFLYPGEVGARRFGRSGLRSTEAIAPLVGAVEPVCGALVLMGLYTRIAVVPLLPYHGLWRFAHQSRTDFSMVMGSLFLLLVVPGPWSIDHWLTKRRMGGAD
jgi:uncharacterized membrane protein YphA (DoxX/SURF4 family)